MNRPLPDNRIPIEIGKTTSFIYKDVYHPITWIGNEPYRPRVETMVISQGRKLWIKFHNKINPERLLDYEFPGGSLDRDCTKEQQAENEVNEEALISIKNLSYSGVQYYETFSDRNVNKYSREFPIGYRGFITDVFVAEYNGKFDKKNVEAKDLDPVMFNNGKFMYISGIIDKLSYDHLFALQNTNLIDDNIKYLIDRYLSSKNVSLENVQLKIITEAPKEDDENDDDVKDYTTDVDDDDDTADVEPEPSGSDTDVEVNDDNEETDTDEDKENDDMETNDTTTDTDDTTNEENDDVKDYTTDADDDDTPDDDTTDEPEPQNDEPEDTPTDTTSTDTDDTTDTSDDSTTTDDNVDTSDESGDGDESMDYTDNADSDSSGDTTEEDDTSTDDTSDSTEDEESTDTEDSNKNNNVKNYNLLLDYQKLHRTIESISDKLEYTIFDNHIMNSVISEVIQNLATLNIHVVKYIEYSFKNDYETNLYNYNVYVQTLRMNLLLLGDAVKLNSEKITSK